MPLLTKERKRKKQRHYTFDLDSVGVLEYQIPLYETKIAGTLHHVMSGHILHEIYSIQYCLPFH